jgi:hypothetical protein
VWSYWSPNARLETLPAVSRQVPVNVAVAESAPLYDADGHVAMPEVASLPRIVKPTGRLYQPFASAGRSASAAVTCGAVASYLSP